VYIEVFFFSFANNHDHNSLRKKKREHICICKDIHTILGIKENTAWLTRQAAIITYANVILHCTVQNFTVFRTETSKISDLPNKTAV